MRVRELLDREPFEGILEKTLEAYWTKRFDRPYQVRWRDARFSRYSNDGQFWIGNSYLNYFVASETPTETLRVVRTQFGRSVKWWQRPFQYAYVWLGTAKATRGLLSQAAFTVRPSVPDAGCCLVMGGNHRLHLLFPEKQTRTLILKTGFDEINMTREVAFRKKTNLAFVPQLIETSGGYFTEMLVPGLSISRVSEELAREVSMEAIRLMAEYVVAPSLAVRNLRHWTREMVTEIEARVNVWRVNNPHYANQVVALAEYIRRRAISGQRGDGEVCVSDSHGDLQPGNIMVDDSRLWITDWESVGTRYVGYDALTLVLGSRRGGSLLDKLQRILSSEANLVASSLSLVPGLDWRAEKRTEVFALYLLEELRYHLAENAGPHLYEPLNGFRPYMDRISAASCILT